MLFPHLPFCVKHSPLIPVFHILFLLPLLDPLLFDTSPGGIKKANLADDSIQTSDKEKFKLRRD